MKHPLLRLASMLVDFVDRQSFGERSDPAWRALLLERAKPLMMDAKLKEALQDAVRQIQGRLGPAEAGRLSLAAQPEQVGGLSLAENKRTR